MRELLALTVLQPFATGIVRWGKPVENRGWLPSSRLPVGAWLAIHAGARDYPGADDLDFRNWIGSLAYAFDKDQRFARGYLASLPHSAIVGVAQIAGYDGKPAGWSPWAHPEQHHWRFANVYDFAEPEPCKGAQGLWTVPDDVAERLRARLRNPGAATLRHYPGAM